MEALSDANFKLNYQPAACEATWSLKACSPKPFRPIRAPSEETTYHPQNHRGHITRQPQSRGQMVS